MKQFATLFILIISLSAQSLAQVLSEQIARQYQEDQMRLVLEAARAELLSTDPQSLPPYAQGNPLLFMINDLDQDWMDDSWEVDNGLDPTDPSDAYTDPDQDYVINLFEYYLSADPQNASLPATINYYGTEDLISLLADAPYGSVIRVAEGVFPQEIQLVLQDSARFMIQGGWDQNFTIYDPSTYLTTFDGEYAHEIFYLSTDTAGPAAVMMDGIRFEHSGDGFQAVGFLTKGNAEAFIGLRNCQIVHDSSKWSGLGINHWDNSQARVAMLNTVIGQNNGTGIYNQNLGDAQAEWRITHCTIHGNMESASVPGFGYGLQGYNLDSSELHIEITNSIIWGNEVASIQYSGFGGNTEILANYCNIDTIGPFGGVVTYLPGVQMQDVDPLFIDTLQLDYNLTSVSPCIDQGFLVGMPYAGDAPDLGAYEYIPEDTTKDSTVSIMDHSNATDWVSVFPNPNQGIFTIRMEDMAHTATFQLLDLQGRIVMQGTLNAVQPQVQAANVIPGIYVLQIQQENQMAAIKVHVRE